MKKFLHYLMHDTLISGDIIAVAKKQGDVKAITVEVGDLAHIPSDELKETLCKMVPGWVVTIVRKKAFVKCDCGFSGEPKILEHSHGHAVFVCPKCGATPQLVSGSDIVLKEVEVE